MIRKISARVFLSFLISLAAFLVACQRQAVTEGRDASKRTDEVTVYVSTDRVFSEPILQAYERKTGVKVNAVYDTEETKSTGLANKLLAEKNNPQADVFWSNEPVRTLVLKSRGALAPYNSPNAEGIPATFKDHDGYWTGFSARIRVIVYNTNLVKPGDAPKSVYDLTEPKWKGQVAIADPRFGSTSFHVAALYAEMGDEKADEFFRKLKANGVKIAPGNSVQPSNVDWKAVERAMGRPGAMQAGDVYRFSMPRGDLRVAVKGVEVKPALALGSWAAFKMAGNQAMVMGDIVMTEDEVNPVISRLQQGGIEQTGLHNHILHESPRVMYMHICGHGDPVKLAEAISAALKLTKTPPPSPPGVGQPQELGIDTKQIEQIIGHGGKVNGGVFQVSVPRAEKITEAGMEVPPSMGVATAINFQPTGAGCAAITGDFVLIASEVNPVIRALRENGIEVTALHNHMLDDEPRLFFMHFWANDDAVKLAWGLRAALDKMNTAKA